MYPLLLGALLLVGVPTALILTQPPIRFLGDRARLGDLVAIAPNTAGLPAALAALGAAAVVVRVADAKDKDVVRGPIVGYLAAGSTQVQPFTPLQAAAVPTSVDVPRQAITGILRRGRPLAGSQALGA